MMAYDSLCGLEEVLWPNICGFKAKSCKECKSRSCPRNRIPAKFVKFINKEHYFRRTDKFLKGWWTDNIPKPHDAQMRLYARRVIGEDHAKVNPKFDEFPVYSTG